MHLRPDDVEALAQAEEEARKQQESGVTPDVSGALDALSTLGDAVVAVAEGAGNILGAIGSVFEGF